MEQARAQMRGMVAIALAMVAGVILLGCEEAATGTGGGTSSPISPPSWIIGTWGDAAQTWTFTRDNAVLTSEILKIRTDLGETARTAGATISDTSPSATRYRITSSVRASGVVQTQLYEFRKSGSDAIEYSLTTNGFGQGPFVLRKR